MKKATMRYIALALLTLFSMGAVAQVKVDVNQFTGGKIGEKGQTKPDEKTNQVTVTLIVTPDKGYTIKKEDITVLATFPTSPGNTRAPQFSDTLELEGPDPADLSAERTYEVKVDANLGLWVKEANFKEAPRGDTKSTDYSGVYYIGSHGYVEANTTTNYYLCPTEKWYYYISSSPFYIQHTDNPNNDNGQPFMTTYQCRNGNYDATKAVWIVEKQSNGYYYIKRKLDGKFLTYNGEMVGSNIGRMRLHLESTAKGDSALFQITYVSGASAYEITTKNSGPDNNRKYLNVTGNKGYGNQPSLQATDIKKDGPGNINVGGIIGLWTSGAAGDNASKWYFEDAHCATPTITYDNSTGEVTITATTGATIYYTLTGADPVVPESGDPVAPTYLYNPASKPTVSSRTVVKAVAKMDGMVNSRIASMTIVTEPVITLAEGPFTYTGTGIVPEVTVKDGETVIDPSEYTVSYSNNTNAGSSATVTITNAEGGSYFVNGSTSFTITPMSIGSGGAPVGDININVKKSGGNYVVTVTHGTTPLTQGTDYTWTHEGDIITVTGKGNYTGTAKAQYYPITPGYYALHQNGKGYLKRSSDNVTLSNDATFRYANSFDNNGSSIWILTTEGYLQSDFYYLNVANDRTLYFSVTPVTQWQTDDISGDEHGKKHLKINTGSGDLYLCNDNNVITLKASPSAYYNACPITLTENSLADATIANLTVQSPQLVTYLHNCSFKQKMSYEFYNDAGAKVSESNKDRLVYATLTYKTSSDTNKGTKWDFDETNGIIYNKQASGNVDVTATYDLLPADPFVRANHSTAVAKSIKLTLQPKPISPEASKNYLLFSINGGDSYRYPYDNGLSNGDPVKPNGIGGTGNSSVLTDPSDNGGNAQISWKVEIDDKGFYSFKNVSTNRYLYYNENVHASSDYGTLCVGATSVPTGEGAKPYMFRLFKTSNTDYGTCYYIIPFSKQFAVFKSDGASAGIYAALNIKQYTDKETKVISLYQPGNNSQWCIYKYEAEYRIRKDFSIKVETANIASATGNYLFSSEGWYGKYIKESPKTGGGQKGLVINGTYKDQSKINYQWTITGLGDYITIENGAKNATGTWTITTTGAADPRKLKISVSSLPNFTTSGVIKLKLSGGNDPVLTSEDADEKSVGFTILGNGSISFTEISQLSDITSSTGAYRLTANVSGSPGVSTFSGILDGDGYTISGLTAPLFTTLNNGTVRNVNLSGVSISSHSGPTGAIAGTADGASRIYNVGILDGQISSSDNVCGGLVGWLDGTARVINCFSYAKITGGTNVGGIVGYNNYPTTSYDPRTMVMNCMFYGDITGGTSKAPIYNGQIITNRSDQGGVGNFNYFWAGASYVQNIDEYNCALSAETRYLQRFEFFRPLLNSNRALAAWWATGSYENKDEMMKWVMEPSQIGTATPYPILKTFGKYPSVVNIDAAHAEGFSNDEATKKTQYNQGRKFGTFTINIQKGSNKAGDNAPSNASITTSKVYPNITDKDPAHFNFNYYKVQLPYYNDVGSNNYTENKVVTGWKIVSMSKSAGSFTTSSDATADVDDGDITLDTPYNFADRKCTAKDIYSDTNKRVFNQGAYFDVPEGVTEITIQPYWAKCVYVSDEYPDVVYDQEMTTPSSVTTIGTINETARYTDGQSYSINEESQVVYTSMSGAVNNLNPSGTVYDNAIVLVGNVHSLALSSDASDKPYTIMSIDLDKDNEPDYSYILRFNDRKRVHPVRVDFLNVIGLGMAQKSSGGQGTYNLGIMQPLDWFEVTNTALFRVTQFEYDKNPRSSAPMILHGGVIEQWVTVAETSGNVTEANAVDYYHVGSNVWFKEFHIGAHQDRPNIYSPHPPISVTGGDFDEFYLTGMYNTPSNNYDDNAECYINGGRFGKVAGTGMQGIGSATNHTNGNIIWQIDNADIDEFYAGGINAAHKAEGNIYTVITNSRVDQFCGGPKFGDMNSTKKVVTNATNCTFRTFFGAGYGGNSYNRRYPTNKYTDYNYSWNSWLTGDASYDYSYSAPNEYNGVETRIDYQFIPKSDNTLNVARLFIDYVSFSLATTHDVTSKLTGCTITTSPLGRLKLFAQCIGNFYGGGSLGKVTGDVKSTLTNCTVEGNVFGGGYSATLPSVEVMNNSFQREPSYDVNTGAYTEAILPSTVPYTWEHATTVNSKETAINTTEHILYTTEDLTSLGAVAGNVILNIDGNTTLTDGKVMSVTKSVYGGGEESNVEGNTQVNVTGGTIGVQDQGGATYGNVYGGGKGKEDKVTAGLVKGNTNVTISGSPSILHNVYGGGAFGSVGDFTYDATTGMPTALNTAETGKTIVTITGGTFGSTGKENGMIFGSSRGLEVNPDKPNVDKIAWVYDTEVNIGTQGSDTGPQINGSVYGGGENGHNFHDAKVTVYSGTIGIAEGEAITDNGGTPDDTSDDITYTGPRYPFRGNVYGAGCGTDTYTDTDGKIYYSFNAGIVRGNTTVEIKGGHVLHSVYGGGAMGTVGTYTLDANSKPTACADGTGTCTVKVIGGQIGLPSAQMSGYGKGGPDDYGHVFGAGRGDARDPNIYPNVETCAFYHDTKVEISGIAFVCGSVYGGSESGHVMNDTDVEIKGGQIGCGRNATEPFADAVWGDDYVPTENLDCKSWSFESPYAPYDPYANATGNLDQYSNGQSTDGGRLEASDGHTYYGNVFGGGSGCIPYFDTAEGISKYLSTAGSVDGNTKVTISGGHILTNVYGGNETTNVKGSATIKMTGATVGVPRTVSQIVAHPVTGYIFGAGKGDQRIFFNKETNVDRATVTVEGGRVYGSVYGGGEDGHILQNVTVTIGKTGETGPTIGTWGTSYFDGNVFGGGRGFGGEALTAGNVGGAVELNIISGKILGSVYGGGRLASVGYGLYLVDEEIEEDGQTIKPYGILRPDDKYDGSYANPSTEEASTYYNKGRGYITINISGGTIGNDYEYQYYAPDATLTSDMKTAAHIPNTTFDYQNRLQYTKGGNVFAGGMGRLYALGNTTLLPLWPKLGKCKQTVLNITGGTIKSSIYGGGEIGVVDQNATVSVTGGTIGTKVVDANDATKYYYFGSVFGGGKGSTDAITYPGGTAEANKIPISEAGTTGGNVTVELNKDVAANKPGGIVNQIFGCNDMNGSPKGLVDVHVYATQTPGQPDISTKPVKDTNTYDVQAVYGGGNLAAYVPTNLETGKATVTIDGCGLTSIKQVYGGGNAASTPATDVTVNGTYEIEELFGGGNGKDALPNGYPNPGANVGYKDYSEYYQENEVWKVRDKSDADTKEERLASSYVYGTGKAAVNVFGGTIHRVFGGSNTKGNVRQTAVTMLEDQGGCEFCVDEAYGGGKSAPMDAEAKLLMSCIPGLKVAYGGAEEADIQNDVVLNITNGTFNRVFGGNNRSGTIHGTITVNIEETGCRPVIIGQLYGGGNLAPYTAPAGQHGPTVNVKSFTSIGEVYGGGFGTTAVVTGDTYVNINEVILSNTETEQTEDHSKKVYDGGEMTYHDEDATTTVTLPNRAYNVNGAIGAIGNVYGGGNAAPVHGNANVNIGTETNVTINTLNNLSKPVIGADIRGNVYGGGNQAEVTGKTNVTIGRKQE